VAVQEAAVSGALAEISPNTVGAGSNNNGFIYDVLLEITGGDTGVNQITVTAPSGYANIAVSSVAVDGTGQTASCTAPGPGEYCATVSGQVMTVELGQPVTTDGAGIQIDFEADAPASGGSSEFLSTVDDNTTVTEPQATAAGDADGDPGDANSRAVTVSGAAVSSVVAEISPNALSVSATDNNFIYDILPTINSEDTGVDEVALTAPSGYTNLQVIALSIGGAVQTPNCPAAAGDEYCLSTSGQQMTFTLGGRVTASDTIQVEFSADAPASCGSGDFVSTVADTTTSNAP
jgi:hypothetical protein